MKTGIVIDISAWQGNISTEQFRQAKADLDLMGVIVQLWGGIPRGMGPNPFAEAQLYAAGSADLPVAGYIWVPPDVVIETDQLVATALSAAGDMAEHLEFVSPDIEDPYDRLLHPTNPVARLNNCLDNIVLAKNPIV